MSQRKYLKQSKGRTEFNGSETRKVRNWDKLKVERVPLFSSASVVRSLCTRSVRLLTWAMLRHPRSNSIARFIPKDVCRIIASFVDRRVVVASGGAVQVTSPRTRSTGTSDDDDWSEDRAFAWDVSELGNTWRPLRRRDVSFPSQPVPPVVVNVNLSLFDQLLWSRAEDVWFLGAFRTAPVACPSCKGVAGADNDEDDDDAICLCCCPRFFRVDARTGVAVELPKLLAVPMDDGQLDEQQQPLPVVICHSAMCFWEDRLWVLGGEELAAHFYLDGCPTCNRPTPATFCLDVWDPDAVWARGPPLPQRRMSHTAMVVGDAIVVVGGGDGDAFRGYRTVRTVFRMARTSDGWEQGPELPRALCRLALETV